MPTLDIRFFGECRFAYADEAVAGRFALRTRREEAFQMQAARAQQAGELDAMMALADAMDDQDKRVSMWLRRAALAEIQGDYAEAVTLMDKIAWDDAPGTDIHSGDARRKLEIKAAVRLGSIYWNQGDYPRAETEYRRGLALAQQAGDRDNEATILLHLGAHNAYYGPYEESLRISQAALDAAHAIGNEEGQIWARNQLAFVIVDQGDDDYGAALDALTAGLALPMTKRPRRHWTDWPPPKSQHSSPTSRDAPSSAPAGTISSSTQSRRWTAPTRSATRWIYF